MDNDKNDLCPSKICCFVKDEWQSSEDNNLMVIIQCAEKMSCKEADDELFPIVERRILNNQYEIVDADCIDQACYAIPDLGNDDGVIIVKPTDTWGN